MYFLTTQSSKEHAFNHTSADALVGVLLIKKQTERKEFLIMVCMSLVKANSTLSEVVFNMLEGTLSVPKLFLG